MKDFDYNMSDEDFLNMSFDDIPQEEVKEEDTVQAQELAKVEEGEPIASTEEEDPELDTDGLEGIEVELNGEDVTKDIDPDQLADPGESTVGKGDSADEEVPDSEAVKETDESDGIDYKAQYNELMAPIRAAGRDITLTSIDDARQLIQMGADYNRKMQDMKQYRPHLKMLENNKLLDEKKLSYLIDLNNKDPKAIKQLIKDSGINPLDVDINTESGYETNNSHLVSESEVNLDSVLESIKGSSSYQETMDTVGSWDADSRETLVQNPQIIAIINAHVENGTYKHISDAVANERMFGRLTGLSDIQAYKEVGDRLAAASNTSTQTKSPTPKADDTKLNEQRRAMASTKPKVKKNKPVINTKQKIEDLLSMSDEEFMQMSAPKY